MFFYAQILQCVFPENKGILLHNQSTVIKFKKFNIDTIVLSNLPSYPMLSLDPVMIQLVPLPVLNAFQDRILHLLLMTL